MGNNKCEIYVRVETLITNFKKNNIFQTMIYPLYKILYNKIVTAKYKDRTILKTL